MGWTHKFILGGGLVRGKLFYDASTKKLFTLVKIGDDELKISGDFMSVLDKLTRLQELVGDAISKVNDLADLESNRANGRRFQTPRQTE